MASARLPSRPAKATGSTICGPFRSPRSICWRKASPERTGGGSRASLSAAFARFAAQLSLDRALRDIAAKRAVLRLGLEWERRSTPVLSLTQYSDSGAGRRDLARCDAHGAWVEWLAG